MREVGAANRAAYGLSLAAAPTFAALALLNGALGGAPSPLCAAAPDALPVGDMGVMYFLMSAFHMGPWLRLMAHLCRREIEHVGSAQREKRGALRI